MKDLKELEKKYEELGKEIERLKNEQQFKKGKYYKSRWDIVLCDGGVPYNNKCFSGIVIEVISSENIVGEHYDAWDKSVFHEVIPTWTKV